MQTATQTQMMRDRFKIAPVFDGHTNMRIARTLQKPEGKQHGWFMTRLFGIVATL
jgi:hypothetical protein